MKQKRGQVWIETVIYTLIAFIMIGLVLSYAKPKIEGLQDKTILEQSVGMMEGIDYIISCLGMGCPGNQRSIELGIKKGVLKIDGVNNEIVFEIESRDEYIEPGGEYQEGKIVVINEKRGNFNLITFAMNYDETYDLTYQGEDKLKSITKSSTPYKLFISNKGEIGNKTVIDVVV